MRGAYDPARFSSRVAGMSRKPRRMPDDRNLTSRFLSGDIDDELPETRQRFSRRSAGAQHAKMQRTALLRLAEQAADVNVEVLPVGQVTQMYSLFCEVEQGGVRRLCVVRKTLSSLLNSPIVTGDLVRFRESAGADDQGRPEAVIEQVLPRRTILTRADSFKAIEGQPIVANADQMLIVTSVVQPPVKWGLIDRMLVAAQGGGLKPIVCLNKIDLATESAAAQRAFDEAQEAMAHYACLGMATLQTSVPERDHVEELRELMRERTTVLAGHSGVGKSSLILSLQPTLDIRIGAISGYTGKGRHTTTSSRRYSLDFGGHVVDTPGVKLFGLWGVSRQNLIDFFPDVRDGAAPPFRKDSYARILQSLPE